MKLDEDTAIVQAVMTDLPTGEKTILSEKKDSKCLFKPVIQYKKYTIQLRLDYTPKGLDNSNNPTLDADVWQEQNGKKIFFKGQWHHTPITFDGNVNRYVYQFNFNGLSLDLAVIQSVRKSITCNMVISDSVDVKLIKKNP